MMIAGDEQARLLQRAADLGGCAELKRLLQCWDESPSLIVWIMKPAFRATYEARILIDERRADGTSQEISRGTLLYGQNGWEVINEDTAGGLR